MKVKALIAELTKVDQEAELSEYYDKRNMSDEGNSVVPVVVLE